jgi:CBS domain-containing protein
VTTADLSIAQTEQALRQEGRQRMAGATITFLKKHAPFNKMTADALQDFAQKAQMAFYPAGSTIVGPDSGNVRFFYLIESGKVQARQAGEVTVTEYSILSLGAGESFPIGAVTAGRPSTNNYIAVEDTFCYKLPADDFMVLMTTSPEFTLFCTQYIASLLNQSRQQLQQQFAQLASDQQTLNSPLSGIGSRSPVSTVCPKHLLRAALETMSQAKVGSLVVAGEDRKPVGVFTRIRPA